MTAVPAITQETSDFVAATRPMLIGGEWVDAVHGGILDVVNPADGQPFASIAVADETDIDRAVTAARAAFDGHAWTGLTPAERGNLLWRHRRPRRTQRRCPGRIDYLGKRQAVGAGEKRRRRQRGEDVPLLCWLVHEIGWIDTAIVGAGT